MSGDYHCATNVDFSSLESVVRRSYVVPWPCDDKEFEALIVLEQVLREVPPPACARLLDYLRAKYGEPAAP